jgi:hypothetical protein
VTYSGAYDPLSEREAPPLRIIARDHSILGVCLHRDVENGFTRPLKVYFLLFSILFGIFLAFRMAVGKLGSSLLRQYNIFLSLLNADVQPFLLAAPGFGEWLLVSLTMHIGHWSQRYLFYKVSRAVHTRP